MNNNHSLHPLFGHVLVNLSINTALVYGAAYAGRSYLRINPAHAAFFALGTYVAAEIGKKLAEDVTRKSYYKTISGRAVRGVAMYTPCVLAVARGVFTPLQVITALGLMNICSGFYFLTGESPFQLRT